MIEAITTTATASCASAPAPRLHVLDDRSGAALEKLEIVVALGRAPRYGLHPGENGPILRFEQAASFPIELERLVKSRSDDQNLWSDYRLFVRSPAYAWERVDLDFKRERDYELRLVPSASLEVELDGDGVGFPLRLRLRADGKGPDQPALDLPIRSDHVAVESLQPGVYAACIEIGPPSKSTELCRRRIELEAGRTTQLSLSVPPVPDGTPVPMQGVVRVPSERKLRHIQLRLHVAGNAWWTRSLCTVDVDGAWRTTRDGVDSFPFLIPAHPPGSYLVQVFPGRETFSVVVPRTGTDQLVLEANFDAPTTLPFATFRINDGGEDLVMLEIPGGCGWSPTRVHRLWPEDGQFVSEHRRISGALVEDLRARVLASRKVTTPATNSLPAILAAPDEFLAGLGIDAQTYEERRDKLLDRYLKMWPEVRPIPTVARDRANYERVKEMLVERALGLRWSTGARHIEVWIPGEPTLRISSTSDSPLLLPWTVRAGSETWLCVDPGVSTALFDIAPPIQGSEQRRDIASWNVWEDDVVWSAVMADIEQTLGELSYRSVPGFEELARRFRITKARGHPGPAPHLPLFVTLEALESHPVHRIVWNPDSSSLSEQDWYEILSLYDQTLRAIDAHAWIGDWLAAAPNRSASLVVDPERLVRVKPAWIHANLPGEAKVQLVLSESKPSNPFGNRAILAMAFDAPGFLVVYSAPVRGPLYEIGMGNQDVARTGVYARILQDSAPELRKIER